MADIPPNGVLTGLLPESAVIVRGAETRGGNFLLFCSRKLAAREIRASVAAQAKVDEMVIFKAMTRIREINANALARQGLLVDDYSQERIAKIENEMLIGLNVDETPHEAQMPPAADGLGLELQTASTRPTEPATPPETPGDADVTWSFGEK